jgi:hypothetical protein
MRMNMTKKIFLSYATPDKEKVPSLVKKLQQHQSHAEEKVVIVDPVNELSEGEDFRQQIRQNIQDSDEVAVVWTTASAASGLVNYEAGMADALGKPIIIVVPDENAPELPGNLQGAEVFRLTEEN